MKPDKLITFAINRNCGITNICCFKLLSLELIGILVSGSELLLEQNLGCENGFRTGRVMESIRILKSMLEEVCIVVNISLADFETATG